MKIFRWSIIAILFFTYSFVNQAFASEKVITAHLISHSHQDAGWLKTTDQYFIGLRNDIQVAAVQYVYDTVVTSLLENPDRIFNAVEVAFFQRWWRQQTPKHQDVVRGLVKRGQLNFINGGYVMHDEACTDYIGQIEQTTLGHRFLKKEFGMVPITQWQIDPFGHSETSASVALDCGYMCNVYGRSDYKELEQNKNNSSLEFYMKFNDQHNQNSSILSYTSYNGNYGPPNGFWWEYSPTVDQPIQDDPRLGDYNADAVYKNLKKQLLEMNDTLLGEDILLFMGSDFCYADANSWFKNLDKLIKLFNETKDDVKFNIKYSRPEDYFKAKCESLEDKPSVTFPDREGDFFPYADFPHAYWTGYFSSRLGSKRQIRFAEFYLQAARQLMFLSLPLKEHKELEYLTEMISEGQHHDIAPGTEKQDVMNDYTKRLTESITQTEKLLNNLMKYSLLKAKVENPKYHLKQETERLQTKYNPQHTDTKSKLHNEKIDRHQSGDTSSALQDNNQSSQSQFQDINSHKQVREEEMLMDNYADFQVTQCLLSNLTICEATVSWSANGTAILIYNPSSRERTLNIHLPAKQDYEYTMQDELQRPVSFTMVPIPKKSHSDRALLKATEQIDGSLEKGLGDGELVFQAKVPLHSFRTFYLSSKPGSKLPQNRHGSFLGRLSAYLYQKYSLLRSYQRYILNSVGFNLQIHRQAFPLSPERIIQKLTKGYQRPMASSQVDMHCNAVLKSGRNKQSLRKKLDDVSDVATINNGLVELEYSKKNGRLLKFVNLETNRTVDLGLEFLLYEGTDGKEKENPEATSGAYLFRPKNIGPFSVPDSQAPVGLKVISGSNMVEARQTYDNFITLRTILYKDDPKIHLFWNVGPVPQIKKGIEVIYRITSSINNGHTFFTDSNSRQILSRTLNKRDQFQWDESEPVAGNYYPVTSTIFMRDQLLENIDQQCLGVTVDRPHGAASLDKGQIEIMLQRRTVLDDARGVAENLNETLCGCRDCNCPGYIVQGHHILTIERCSDQLDQFQERWIGLNRDPLIFFGSGKPFDRVLDNSVKEEKDQKIIKPTLDQQEIMYSGQNDLNAFVSQWKEKFSKAIIPPNIELISIQKWEENQYLLRLQNLYQGIAESKEPATEVDVQDIVQGFCTIKQITEMSLAGSLTKGEIIERRHQWKACYHDQFGHEDKNYLDKENYQQEKVVLNPFEIKTLLLTCNK